MAHGLLAQYMHPQVTMVSGAPAVPSAVYGSIGLGLLCQLINIVVILTPDVVKYFANYEVNKSTSISAIAVLAIIVVATVAGFVTFVVGRVHVEEELDDGVAAVIGDGEI